MLFLPGSAQEGDKTRGGDMFVRCLQRNIIFMKTLILFKCNVKKKKTYRNKNVTCFLHYSYIYNASSLFLNSSCVYSPHFEKL